MLYLDVADSCGVSARLNFHVYEHLEIRSLHVLTYDFRSEISFHVNIAIHSSANEWATDLKTERT